MKSDQIEYLRSNVNEIKKAEWDIKCHSIKGKSG